MRKIRGKAVTAIVVICLVSLGIFFGYWKGQKRTIEDLIISTDTSVVLYNDGTVWSGTKSDLNEFYRVESLKNINKIVYTGTAFYALTEKGEVYAWADNEELMVDYREEKEKYFNEPVKISELSGITDIDVKNGKAFAIDKSGNLFVWGLHIYEGSDEADNMIPGSTETLAINAGNVEKIFAGAGNYHYFIREDGTAFSIMVSERFAYDVDDFLFPDLSLLNGEDAGTDLKSSVSLGDIEYVDLGEGSKETFSVLYELGDAGNVRQIVSDGYTMFVCKEDGSLYYWDSNMIRFHDNKNAIADVESGCENYRGTFVEIDVSEVLGIDAKTDAVPQIAYMCAGKENVLFLTEDGQLFVSEYVTTGIEDVQWYFRGGLSPSRMEIQTIYDMQLKDIVFTQIEAEDIVNINSDGGYIFTIVDKEGAFYNLNMSRGTNDPGDKFTEFIRGNCDVYLNDEGDTSTNIIDILTPTGEPDERDAAWFTLFDSNGDNIPELHVKSVRDYCIIIFDRENDSLKVWATAYPQTELLNNGAYLYTHLGGAPSHEDYIYFTLDRQGNESMSVSFSRYDSNSDGDYDAKDLYLFEGEEVTWEMWKESTEEYLSVGSDEIDWKEIHTGAVWMIRNWKKGE